MPLELPASSRRIPVSNLSPDTFAPFGEVVQNPQTHNGEPTLETVEANQGTATKWLDVSHMENFYATTYREQPAKCVMNMFVCRPRELREGRLFDVKVLERHPYTPQTFIPMGLSSADKETAYLVIVAPTLPCMAWLDKALPIEHAQADYSFQLMLEEQRHKRRLRLLEEGKEAGVSSSNTLTPKEDGPPDLANMKAFIARGDQAVTYGPRTWHAPMVVLGEKEIEFLVVQYANGIAADDVQEIMVQDDGEAFEVDLSLAVDTDVGEKSKL